MLLPSDVSTILWFSLIFFGGCGLGWSVSRFNRLRITITLIFDLSSTDQTHNDPAAVRYAITTCLIFILSMTALSVGLLHLTGPMGLAIFWMLASLVGTIYFSIKAFKTFGVMP